MKIRTVEEAKQLYDVVYDLPDELLEEFENVKKIGGLNSIKEFLDERANVVSSEQHDGSYSFKLLDFEEQKGDDK